MLVEELDKLKGSFVDRSVFERFSTAMVEAIEQEKKLRTEKLE